MQPVDHLIAAVLEDDEAKLRAMLTDSPELATTRNLFGVSPLHAARYTHPRLQGLLASETLDIYLAAELGEVERLGVILSSDPSQATAFNAAGSSVLHGASYWGQLECVRFLLEAGADVGANTRDTFLQITPLGSAIATTPGVPQPSDKEEVVLTLVRLLLEHGADPTQPRLDGMTPLHSAAWRGLAQVAQELLDAGADPGATATSGAHAGQAPADTALSQGHLILAAHLDNGKFGVANPYG